MRRRITWIDFSRGITMLFVVFGHSLSTIYSTNHIASGYFTSLMSILFTFMMPCFFAISGYLYRPIRNLHDYILMIYKKLVSLGLPYVIFSVIYVTLQNCGGSNVNHVHSFHDLFHIYSMPISYLWFLYALFFMFLIVGLFDLIHINIYVQSIIYISFLFLSIFRPNIIPTGLISTFGNILYFYIGYILSRIHFYRYSKYILVTIILFILSYLIQINYTTSTMAGNSTFSDFITKILSVILLVQISIKVPHNKIFRYFDKYGKITLIIYLVHGPTISVFRALSFKIIPINSEYAILLSFILVIVVWYISLFLCFLANHFNVINFIFYPRKKYISKWIRNTTFGRWIF